MARFKFREYTLFSGGVATSLQWPLDSLLIMLFLRGKQPQAFLAKTEEKLLKSASQKRELKWNTSSGTEWVNMRSHVGERDRARTPFNIQWDLRVPYLGYNLIFIPLNPKSVALHAVNQVSSPLLCVNQTSAVQMPFPAFGLASLLQSFL